MTASARFADALVDSATQRLEAGVGFVRIPVLASPLPIQGILERLAHRQQVRVAVFTNDSFATPPQLMVTSEVHVAIDWRNDGKINDDLVIIGDLERDRAAGLADLPCVTGAGVRDRLFSRTIGDLELAEPPAALTRLLACLGSMQLIADLAACADYCEAVASAGSTASDVARSELWQLGLFPDLKSPEIDAQQLRRNADLIAKVRSMDATSLQRLVAHADEIGERGYGALRRFAATGDLAHLKNIDLTTVINALRSVTTPKPQPERMRVSERKTFVDAVLEAGYREEDFLKQVQEISENGSSDSSVRIAGETFEWDRSKLARVSELLSDPASEADYSESAGSVEALADDERLAVPGRGDVSWKSLTAIRESLRKLEARRGGEHQCGPLLDQLVEKRRVLVPYLPSIANEGVSLFVGSSRLREAASELIGAWLQLWGALLQLKEDIAEGEQAYVLTVAEQLSLTDLRVLTHGADVSAYVLPLHPVVLEPRVRAAKFFLQTPYLSADFYDLVRESLDPAMPSITLRLGDTSSSLGYAGMWNGLPFYARRPNQTDAADIPRTLQQIIGRFVSIHPYAELSLSLTLVEPPATVAKALYRWLGDSSDVRRANLNVFASTRTIDETRAALDEAAEELVSGEIPEASRRFSYAVEQLDDQSDIEGVLDETRLAPHLVVFFNLADASLSAGAANFGADALGSLVTEWDFTTNPLQESRPIIRPKSGSDELTSLIGRQAKLFGSALPTQERSPLLAPDVQEQLARLADRATWLVVSESASSLVPPLELGELQLLGRLVGSGHVAFVYSRQLRLLLEPILRYLQQSTWIHPHEDALIQFLLGSVRKAIPEGLLGFFKSRGNLSNESVLGRMGLAAVLAYLESELAETRHLVVSLDTGGARRWLGLRDGPELRADLLVLQLGSHDATIDAIEIKSRTDAPQLTEPLTDDLAHAVDQVSEMSRLLGQIFGHQAPDAFTPSRKEILKRQVFLEALQQWEDIRLADSDAYEALIGELNRVFGSDAPPTRIGKRVFVVSPNAHDSDIHEETLRDTRLTLLGVDWFKKAIAEESGATVEIPLGALDELAEYFAPDLVETAAETQVEGGGNKQNEQPVAVAETEDRSTPQSTPESDRAGLERPADARPSDQVVELPAEATDLARRLRDAFVARNAPFKAIEDDQIVVGPAVVRIPFTVPAGVKLAALENQEADIARDLGVDSVRIANFAGRPGFAVAELPREAREFPDVTSLERPAGVNYPALALGAEFDFNPCWVELPDLPHLLVGGTTGSGKSVFLRSLLWQLTHLYDPSELDLVLIDAKGMADYLDFISARQFKHEGDFHLGVEGALELLEDIVEQRLPERTRLFRDYAQSALRGPNPHHITNLRELLRDAEETRSAPPVVPLVVIIDEFAELMFAGVDRKRFETLVTRFNQTARAVGGHLIAATQRPSVDVVTGVMKSNFARVALRVQQSIDSRVILDENGAEMLLGRGDLLFKSLESGVVRLQGYAAFGPYEYY